MQYYSNKVDDPQTRDDRSDSPISSISAISESGVEEDDTASISSELTQSKLEPDVLPEWDFLVWRDKNFIKARNLEKDRQIALALEREETKRMGKGKEKEGSKQDVKDLYSSFPKVFQRGFVIPEAGR